MRAFEAVRLGEVFTSQPTLSGGAHSDGAYLATIQLTDAFLLGSGKSIVLDSIDITDLVEQNSDFDFLFFDAEPTISSAQGSSIVIADAEMTKKIGSASLRSCSSSSSIWISAGGSSSVTASNLGLRLRRKQRSDQAIGSQFIASKDIWAVVIVKRSSGSATYLESSLIFKFGVTQD